MAAALVAVCAAADAQALPLCSGGKRISCVVDGDTFWLAGEKIRIEGVDAPEMDGRCLAERERARRATARLSKLLAGRSIDLRRNGTDLYGRTLAAVYANGRDVAEVLVREGHARQWTGRRESWCDE